MSDKTKIGLDSMVRPVTGELLDQKDLVERLLAHTKDPGVSVVGPGGLLSQLTKNVLEAGLEAELADHVDHERGGAPMAANMPNAAGRHGSHPRRREVPTRVPAGLAARSL